MAGVTVVLAIFAYLCIPGHPLGTFFYNAAPPIFRMSVGFLQSTNIASGRPNGFEVWTEVENHIFITLLAIGFASAWCVPLGIIASRVRVVKALTTNVVGFARGVPGIAVMFLMYPWIGLGLKPALVALTILAAPPIFLNTAAGFGGVDQAVVEAARGMGMNRLQTLLRIESPLAAPVVVAGLRTATVEVIASATIAPYLNFDTLGTQIFGGLAYLSTSLGQEQLAVGVSAVAGLALLAELLLTLVQRIVTPRGLQTAR